MPGPEHDADPAGSATVDAQHPARCAHRATVPGGSHRTGNSLDRPAVEHELMVTTPTHGQADPLRSFRLVAEAMRLPAAVADSPAPV
jgi:hypothetical protein